MEKQENHLINENFSPVVDLVFEDENLDFEENSKIINYQPDTISVKQTHCIKLEIPSMSEWKINLIDILKEKNILFFAVRNKIYSLRVMLKTCFKQATYKNSKSLKVIFVCEDEINQIKIIKDQNNINKFIICVDMKGFLHKIDLDTYEFQKFDCKNETNVDNSCWSLDGHYPYVAGGGNHFKIKIHNVENLSETKILTLSNNKHNVPCVSFSPCGNFILSASIDKYARIVDFYTGKLIKEFKSDDEWGWCVKLCFKKNFSSKFINKSDYLDPPSDIGNNNIITLFPEAIIKDDLYLLDPVEITPRQSFKDIVENNLYNQEVIKSTLDKYILFHTTQYCLYIWDPCEDLQIVNKTKRNFLGKINLLKNYLKTVFFPQNLTYSTIYESKYYVANSRYDNLFVCGKIGLLVVSNRAGDIQIYDLCINLIDLDNNKNYARRFNKKPLVIIKSKNIISGIRVIEEDKFILIIVLLVDKTLEIYKIDRNLRFENKFKLYNSNN